MDSQEQQKMENSGKEETPTIAKEKEAESTGMWGTLEELVDVEQ